MVGCVDHKDPPPARTAVERQAVHGAAVFGTGTFTKSVTTPVATQVVPHSLGEVPKALLIWSVGATGTAFVRGTKLSIGFSDGVDDFSSSSSTQDAASPTQGANWLGDTLMRFSAPTGAVLAEAVLGSWDASQFTLDWTTNDAEPYTLHYLLIGGTNVSANALAWNGPALGVTGNVGVTGFGFEPDVTLHLSTANAETTYPAGHPGAHVTLSVADKAGNQWQWGQYSRSGLAQSSTARHLFKDYILSRGNQSHLARFVSMDPDGFTIEVLQSGNGLFQYFTLALKGVSARAGFFTKSTAPAPVVQAVTGVGFAPGALLLGTMQFTPKANAQLDLRMGMGATDGADVSSVAFYDQDNVSPSNVAATSSATRVLTKVDNSVGMIDAQAQLSSFDADGFSLEWTTNDAVGTDIAYLVLAGTGVVGPAPIGTACVAGSDCASGFCADGVCCNGPCTGGCESCSLAGAVGTCTAHPAQEDPELACGTGPCRGTCDGLGACAFPPTSVSCGTCLSCDGTYKATFRPTEK